MLKSCASVTPNPPMGGVKAGQIGMREPTREKGLGSIGTDVTRQRVFSSRTGPRERSMAAGNRVIVRSGAAGCTRVPGGREFGGVGSVADVRRQAGNGMARSRARARLNCSSQGQRRGRCRVNRRAERVSRPAMREEPPPEGLGGHYLLAQAQPRRPAGEVMRHHLGGQPSGVGGEAPRGEMGSALRRTSGLGWRSRSRRGGDDRPPVPGSPHPGR